jgi:ribosomal protein S18 acetylase RimI-like enzyme
MEPTLSTFRINEAPARHREMLRNETPFLHVMHDNTGARQLYERMGFRNHEETVVRVISRD